MCKDFTRPTPRHHSHPRAPGFTLIELIVVIVVLAILSGVAIPKYFNMRDQSRESAAKRNRAALATAVNQWRLDTAASGTAGWPTTLDLVLQTRQGEDYINPYRLPTQPVYLPDPTSPANKWHPEI